MFKRILIITDFSDYSNFALKRAIQFAKAAKAELTCLHINNRTWMDNFNFNNEDIEITDKNYIKKAEVTFNETIKKLKTRFPVKFKVLTGHATEEIVNYIKKHSIDIVFMGAHGNYYINDYFFGTSAESIIQNIDIPVQVVKKKPTFTYKRILVTTDFSNQSKRAVEIAYKAYSKAHFELLHIADVWYGRVNDRPTNRKLNDTMSKELYKRLDNFLKSCEVEHDRFSVNFIGGYPAEDIANYACLNNSDLVVTGANSRSLLHYLLLGRVTNDLLRINPTDMLII